MARYSSIGDIANMVKKNARTAKEVMESTGKSANKNASMIKNCVNTVQSNLSSGQARAAANLGVDSGSAIKEGIRNAVNQVNIKPVNQVLEESAQKGQSAAQKAYEVVSNRRVNQVIDGHNARQRDVDMQTIVNNVKDRNINRVPKDHEAARQAVENANQTVRNARIINEPDVDPMYTPKNTTYSYMNNDGPNTNTRQRRTGAGNRSQQRDRRRLDEAQPEVEPQFDFNNNQQTYKAVEPEFDLGGGGNGSGGGGGNRTETGGPNTNNTGGSGNRKQRQKQFSGEGIKNQAFDFFTGGIRDSYQNIRDGQGVLEAIGNAHKNADGSMNWMRATGTFMTASAAARVASGGGLYKDRYGNPNLIGVPFI